MSKINLAEPLYKTVADKLFEQIEKGELQANERIPSEAALGKIHAVGRNTVRRAIAELVNSGVLQTVQGVGTFVADNRLTKTAEYLYGFTQEMQSRGKQVSNKVIEVIEEEEQ